MHTRASFWGTAISTLYYEMPAKEGAHVWLEDHIASHGSCMEWKHRSKEKKNATEKVSKWEPNEKATKCHRRKTLVAVGRLVWQALIRNVFNMIVWELPQQTLLQAFSLSLMSFCSFFCMHVGTACSRNGTCARSWQWWLWECNFAYSKMSKSSQDLRKDHRLVYVRLVLLVGDHSLRCFLLLANSWM